MADLPPMSDSPVISWLLNGDPSIAYQTRRDLLDSDRPELQAEIGKTGWGKAFMDARNHDGSWGDGFYKPYWTASHFTLLDLKSLAFPPDDPAIRESLEKICRDNRAGDGGIGVAQGDRKSDVCVNGLFLSYAAHFGLESVQLEPVLDFLLSERMPDGGFNCMRNRSGAKVSSLHSTLSVIEGFSAFLKKGYSYREVEVRESLLSATETILDRQFFRSRRCGNIIDKRFLDPVFPARWRFNILRALDTFQFAGVQFDTRMTEAIQKLAALKQADGRWLRHAALPGKTHFEMEPARKPSRWITLICLRILRSYRTD